jgi:predicted transcriptional regulator
MSRGTERDLSGAAVPLAVVKLEALAVRLERSRVWIITQALVGFIDQAEEVWRLTLEALADVDSGRLVTHEAVPAWTESLDNDNSVPLPLPCSAGAENAQGTARPSKTWHGFMIFSHC